jgi:meiotically up-regulated gene 157 (Mug157) protein
MPKSKTAVGFQPHDAERLLQILRTENIPKLKDTKDGQVFVRESDAGIVSTEITARSGTTVGTGVVDSIFRTNDDGTDYQYSTVQNIFEQSVAVDTYVLIQRLMDGTWVVQAADC